VGQQRIMPTLPKCRFFGEKIQANEALRFVEKTGDGRTLCPDKQKTGDASKEGCGEKRGKHNRDFTFWGKSILSGSRPELVSGNSPKRLNLWGREPSQKETGQKGPPASNWEANTGL